MTGPLIFLAAIGAAMSHRPAGAMGTAGRDRGGTIVSIGVILAIVALVCAIVDYFVPSRHLLNVGLACVALALLA